MVLIYFLLIIAKNVVLVYLKIVYNKSECFLVLICMADFE